MRHLAWFLFLPGCSLPRIPEGEVTLYLKRGNVELNAPGFSISGDVEDFLYERISDGEEARPILIPEETK